jgi:hypothetical protein
MVGNKVKNKRMCSRIMNFGYLKAEESKKELLVNNMGLHGVENTLFRGSDI